MVSPIERQQSILQTNITERIQQTQQQHADMQQRYFEIQFKEERKKMLQKIKESEEAERTRIREEAGRKQHGGDQRNNNADANDLPKQTSTDPDQHSRVDVKV